MKNIHLSVPDDGTLRVSLARRQVVSVPHADGMAFEALSGSVWVTESGSAADRLLRPGERFVPLGQGTAVFEALETGEVALIALAAEPAAPSRWQRIRDAVATALTARPAAPAGRSVDAAMRCWRTLRSSMSTTNLGLERTF